MKALRKVGCSAQEAIEIVAKAHAVDPETVRHWRKTLGKDTELEAQMLMGQLPNSIFPLTKDGLLKAVEWWGQAFKDAQDEFRLLQVLQSRRLGVPIPAEKPRSRHSPLGPRLH